MARQKGFSLTVGLLIILLIATLSFAGYFVTTHQKNTEPASSSSQEASQAKADSTNSANNKSAETSKENSISKDWKRFTSGKGYFSIKIANGLSGVRDTSSDFFIFRKFTSLNGAAAVEDVDGWGSDGFAALTIFESNTSDLWNPAEKLNSKKESFTTYDGLVGTKETFEDPYVPPCEGLGCYLGDKQTIYDFTDNETGKTLRVWYSRQVANDESKKVYSITEDSPDYTNYIDEMVRTLEVKNN